MRAAEVQVKVLFFLRTPNLDRLYASLLEELLERGHSVTVVVEKDRDNAQGAGGVLARLEREQPAFARKPLVARRDRWYRVRRSVRLARDFLRYTNPVYGSAPAPRSRARRRTPAALRRSIEAVGTTAVGRRMAAAVLERLERIVPVPAATLAEVAAERPDVVVVSPLVSFGSAQTDWVAAAEQLGIPSVLPVASWDNLTNKGLVKREPSLVIVWNEAQADEAVRLHGVRRERVVVAGAHSFDHWFRARPTRTHAELARAAGLPDDGAYLLYLCSSSFITGDETGFVAEWVSRLRRAADPVLRAVNVLVRPHPLNGAGWDSFTAPDERVAIWPAVGELPTDDGTRAAFYDSLHHSAGVVGINTSALVEAAIAGRRSFTIVTDRFAATQDGTLHFSQIAGPGGLVHVARDWDDHHAALAASLAAPGGQAEEIAEALRVFARPHGLDLPAAPIAVDAIEAVVRDRRG